MSQLPEIIRTIDRVSADVVAKASTYQAAILADVAGRRGTMHGRGGHGGHRIFEDLVPLAEDQVGGDDHGLLLVAFGQEVEEHFHLFAGLLDVADVVDDDGVETLEAVDGLGQLEVAFGGEQLGDQPEGGHEEHLELVPADPLPGDGGDEVGLAAAGQTEAEQVVAAAHEVGVEQGGQLATQLLGQKLLVEGLEAFARGQVGVFEDAGSGEGSDVRLPWRAAGVRAA